MPQLYKFGAYTIYFWSNESNPLEPIHVHIAEGRAIPNGTKIWITQNGHAVKANNNAKIPEQILRKLMKMVEANSARIVERWIDCFGEIRYYC